MKKVAQIIGGILVFIVVSQAVKFGFREYREHASGKNFKAEMIQAIEALNKQTPIIMNETTSITEVKVENDVVIYKTSLGGFDYNAIDINRMAKSQRITNLFFVCENKDTKYIVKNGLDIKYDYYTPSGQSLFGNQISALDCAPFFESHLSNLVQNFITLQGELLPMTLDAETNWIAIARTGNSIEITYQFINYARDELDLDALKQFVTENSPAKNCIAPDMALFLKKGMSIIDTYVDNAGKEAYSFKTDLSNC